MKKSISNKYFVLLCSVIIACIICLGSVLLLTVSQFYKNETKNDMFAEIKSVVDLTSLHCSLQGSLNAEYLSAKYFNYSDSHSTDFLLLDAQGNAVVSSDFLNTKKKYDVESLELKKVNEAEQYFAIVNNPMENLSSGFIAVEKITLNDTPYYIYAVKSTKDLRSMMLGLLKIFFIVTLILMVVVFIIIYFMIKALMQPVKEMIDAADRFGKGKFDEKIDVKYDNEIGILAQSLNDMAYSLSKIEETRKNFIANVSHELKTPMTSIGGFVDGILDGTIPPEKHRHYLKIVSEEVYRLARLVRSMLNISKYEAGEMEINYKEFNVTELTAKTAFLFESKIDAKKLDIRGLDSDAHYVRADHDLTQQVIYNLIENAVKFVNTNGYISFGFYENKEDGKTYISIKNSGEGLTQEELPKVFDRFYKTDESHGKDKTGVGLGLSIVRSIVKLHGGQVMVRSVVNEYTEFSFPLPTCEKPEEKDNSQE